MAVIVAGGGIGGLVTALTCHQIGVDVWVYESAQELQPLGVGINLQPNAVRELFDLGLADQLAGLGVATEEWALVASNGREVWSEPRGLRAGYRWPQYSVHRGELQMMLLAEVRKRCGADRVMTGHRLVGYQQTGTRIRARFDTRDGNHRDIDGDLLIGADGLHSAARRQLFPDEGEPIWGGAVLWRGTALGPPIRTGASFTLIGNLNQRFVHYPIGQTDPRTGLQRQNWIAELTFDPDRGWDQAGWNRQVDPSTFLPAFHDWDFGWLNVADLVGRADGVWEYPMVDRDPAPTWCDQRMALLGDAAHVMYPVGSNGASQAIVDARVLGAALVTHGPTPEALTAYEDALRDDISTLILRNRGAGPIGILGVVDERCGGKFDDINDVIAGADIEAYMADYRAAAGFAIEQLNNAEPTIAGTPPL